MKASETIAEIVQHALAPGLKREGFRKQRLSFSRRRGRSAHFIQVQLSSWNQGAEGAFYVNVGVMFDEIREHCDQPVPAIPAYDDCSFMVRLEKLVAEAPTQWNVNAQTDVSAVGAQLARCVLQEAVTLLNGVTDLATFKALGWQRAVSWGFPAYSCYLLGDLDKARALVQAQADYFHDRGVTYGALVQHYRFSKLDR